MLNLSTVTDGQSEVVCGAGLHLCDAAMSEIAFALPTTRELARPVNISAFIDTNPTDEPITSGLPVIQEP